MKTIQENINNLTSLWKLAGQSLNQFTEEDNHYKSIIKNTEWPNRIWLKSKHTEEEITLIKKELKTNPNITFSFFNLSNNLIDLDLKSIQYGMSLKLSEKFNPTKNIEFSKAQTLENATLWQKTYYESVKYKICPEIIIAIKEEVDFFLVYLNNKVIGTIVTYKTGNTIGIHSLSILPKHRKKSYATEIMLHILNKSISEKIDLVTLQASKMAKHMYENLGFTSEFTMENYKLKTI